MKRTGPLSDIRLVEIVSARCAPALRLAVGFAGRISRDLGAQVRVVRLDADPIEQIEPRLGGQSALSHFLARDKQLTEVPDQADRIEEQLCDADVVLCDAPIHAAHAGGNPSAVWSIASFGGADEGRAAQSEFTVMAAGGLLDLVGEPDGPPLRLGGHQLAYSAGLALQAGFTAALIRREREGQSDTVRVSLADVAVWLNWKIVALASWSAQPVSRRGSDSEWRTVRCADGWVALVYLEADWPALRELVADPRLSEPSFDDRVERRRHAGHINAIIEAAFLRFTRAQLREVALAKRLPIGAVWSPDELEADPQNQARGFLTRLPHATDPPLLLPQLPLLWNGQRPGGP